MSQAEAEAVAPEATATASLPEQQTEGNGAEVGKTTPANGNADGGPVKSEDEEKVKSPERHVRTDANGVLKTSARSYDDPRKNSKYDPSVLPETDDPKKIRAQVEFYFGDANLPGDKFMWETTGGPENKPIKVETICSFGRMKRFRPVSAVVAALKESEFLEVSGPEGQEEVKRKIPYDENSSGRSKAESRSVYVKGFGDEEPSSQFDIEAFFAPYGPTNAVRLRRTNEKLFKGSVFVEFQDDETAQKFLALDPKPKWKGKYDLIVMSKKEYQDKKEEEIREGKTEPSETRARGRGRGRGHRGSRGGDRGDRDPDDWKKRREEDIKSGFKDRRNGHKNHRGGRGGRRDDRGPRNNDRNREREEKNGYDPLTQRVGIEKLTNCQSADAAVKTENEKKRPREDDGGAEEAPAKKVDVKTEVAAES
ncbi:hypothetical protein F5884DRAFT_822688 [Xylogone sp. PMI_703]|nr:hypothetical protein F5884DRAFT_822688 [Xylogone sp. PMI_703]